MTPFERGLALRLVRKARGVTQEALSETLGVSRSLVAQWETGRASFRQWRIGIAKALNVDVGKIPNEILDLDAVIPKSSEDLLYEIRDRLARIEERLS